MRTIDRSSFSLRRAQLSGGRSWHALRLTTQLFKFGLRQRRYVIMPDHIHLFCAPNDLNAPPLERWMRFWKSLVTREMGQAAGALWQRHHWDRQLRSGESYTDKWEYVRSNPVRHGLVANASEWPYQGELNVLSW